MSIEENKTIVRRYHQDLWNRWELKLVNKLIAPGISFHGSMGVAARGRDEFRKYVSMVRAAFSGFGSTNTYH